MKRVLIVENGAGFGGALTSLADFVVGVDAGEWEIHCLAGYPQSLITTGGAVRRVEALPRQRRYGPASSLEPRLGRFLGRRAGNVAFVLDRLTTGRTYARAVAAYVRRHGIDLVQGNNGVLINDAVLRGAGLAGVPCLIHTRSFEHQGRLTAWLARGADGFLAVSGAVADSLLALGVDRRRVSLVPEGLDADGFAAKADAAAFRARHGLPPDRPLVGLVACLAGWKGQDVFVDACAQALPGAGAGAIIVGGDPDGSGSRLAALRRRVRAMGLEDSIQCLGHEHDVASAMAACSVVVHASTRPEPFGRVLLEAMALGRPVIATDAGGPSEVVDPERDGLLAPPNDVPALAAAMARLLADPALRHSLGQAGWNKVRRRYGVNMFRSRITAVWEKILDQT